MPMNQRMHAFICAGAVFCFAGTSFCAGLMDDAGLFEEPEPEIGDLLPATRKEANLFFKIPADCNAFGFDLKLNHAGKLRIQLETGNGEGMKTITVQSRPQILKYEDGREEVFHNHILAFSSKSFHIPYYAYPDFQRYTPAEINRNMLK